MIIYYESWGINRFNKSIDNWQGNQPDFILIIQIEELNDGIENQKQKVK
jgi:hypothetical protein